MLHVSRLLVRTRITHYPYEHGRKEPIPKEPMRFANAGDFHLDDDRCFADPGQRTGRSVADGLNEAVNLGIAINNMRQSEGIRYEALFRDETVGALDAVNGKEYVRMLRRARGPGRCRQLLFICPHPSRVRACWDPPCQSAKIAYKLENNL